MGTQLMDVNDGYDVLVDASGESCPMPLLKAKMQLNKMSSGEVLKVVATDAGSVRDFASFISLTPHSLRDCSTQNGTFVYLITKG